MTANTGYLFLNENDIARRNSQRARGELGATFTVPIDFNVNPTQTAAQTTLPPPERSKDSLQVLYPWLNERALAMVPEPLKRSVESRAIERFFISWILYPGRNGTPGHMANLPVLYYSAPADSALAHAVRTVAFADVRHCYEQGVSFNSLARRSYGAALSRIREITELESELASDQAFAAVLLIDSFEVGSPHLLRQIPLADSDRRADGLSCLRNPAGPPRRGHQISLAPARQRAAIQPVQLQFVVSRQSSTASEADAETRGARCGPD